MTIKLRCSAPPSLNRYLRMHWAEKRKLRVKFGEELMAGFMALDVPFLLEAAWRLRFGHYHVVHAVEEAAHLIAPFARLFKVPLVMDVDSSIPDQLRYSGFATRGPLLRLAEGLERHALQHSAAAITVCASLTEGVKARAPGLPVCQGPSVSSRRSASTASGRGAAPGSTSGGSSIWKTGSHGARAFTPSVRLAHTVMATAECRSARRSSPSARRRSGPRVAKPE